MTNFLYSNPIGEIVDMSYNNMNNYFKNKKTVNAQVSDFEKKYKSNELQLFIWSSTAAIGILIVLALIRNIRE
tara:strand:+ start:2535 stop:2753 length:219 start_codon:yes stop_codon:yes gene_type:complete